MSEQGPPPESQDNIKHLYIDKSPIVPGEEWLVPLMGNVALIGEDWYQKVNDLIIRSAPRIGNAEYLTGSYKLRLEFFGQFACKEPEHPLHAVYKSVTTPQPIQKAGVPIKNRLCIPHNFVATCRLLREAVPPENLADTYLKMRLRIRDSPIALLRAFIMTCRLGYNAATVLEEESVSEFFNNELPQKDPEAPRVIILEGKPPKHRTTTPLNKLLFKETPLDALHRRISDLWKGESLATEVLDRLPREFMPTAKTKSEMLKILDQLAAAKKDPPTARELIVLLRQTDQQAGN
jgi:hypothetical protein